MSTRIEKLEKAFRGFARRVTEAVRCAEREVKDAARINSSEVMKLVFIDGVFLCAVCLCLYFKAKGKA